ncbi:MAG: hypothetical protein FGM40_07860 [Rhodocyclaceae bacterium]|nr:hypothetical protein [Rhodocyclaceae bacterium]
MPKHFLHRFAFEANSRRYWIALHDEQMDAVLSGERRVVEALPRGNAAADAGPAWWYFNDTGIALLRVEAGSSATDADPVWEGRIHDAYVGRLCSVLLL